VENCVEWPARFCRPAEKLFKGRPILQFALKEFDTSRHELATAVAQVIEYKRLVAALCERGGNCSAYISGTAGNQNSHKNTVSPERFEVT
jgi:hypothetical protein